MFPSTFQRTMLPSFLGLHVTSSCSQPLETRKRGRGEYTTATHTYNPFQPPTPGDKERQGKEERKVGREKRRTSTQSLHMISKELAVRFILSKHSPRTPLHTFTTPPHHSSPPHLHHTPSPLIPTTFTTPPHYSSLPLSPHLPPLIPTTHPPTLSPPTFTTHPHPHPHHIPHHSSPPYTLPHLPLALTTHLHHSPSPPKLTTLAVVCCVSADSSPC